MIRIDIEETEKEIALIKFLKENLDKQISSHGKRVVLFPLIAEVKGNKLINCRYQLYYWSSNIDGLMANLLAYSEDGIPHFHEISVKHFEKISKQL